ncbi:TPA: lngG [Salmonella enterica]|nr:lngG [Salmonella enterica]
MQKINVIIPLLFLTSFHLQAAVETATQSTTVSAQPQIPPAAEVNSIPTTAGQDQIVRALQDDIVFERQKRQLSNELALEKLRAELQKVRGESTPAASMSVTPPPAVVPVHNESPVEASPTFPPAVVLVSQVAGVSKVGITVNGQLRFVGRNETFNANGKKYHLVPTKNNLLVAREMK